MISFQRRATLFKCSLKFEFTQSCNYCQRLAIVGSLTRILRLYSCPMLFLARASFASASCLNFSRCSGVSGTTLGIPELVRLHARGRVGRIVVPPQLSQRLLLVLTAYFRSFQHLAELLHKGLGLTIRTRPLLSVLAPPPFDVRFETVWLER